MQGIFRWGLSGSTGLDSGLGCQKRACKISIRVPQSFYDGDKGFGCLSGVSRFFGRGFQVSGAIYITG